MKRGMQAGGIVAQRGRQAVPRGDSNGLEFKRYSADGTGLGVTADPEHEAETATGKPVALAADRRRKMSETEESEVVRRYSAGERVESIATDLRMHWTSVYDIARRLGVSRPRTRTCTEPSWYASARERYERGDRCADIALALGKASATVLEVASRLGWQRLEARCAHCGDPVPLGKRPNQSERRRCAPCNRRIRSEYKRSRSAEQRQVDREREKASLHSRGKRRPMAEVQAEHDAQRGYTASERRQRPQVQVGLYRYSGEAPTTVAGALAILQATLAKLLDVRCAEAGVHPDSARYRARYAADADFREQQKAKAVQNRAKREAMPRDGTLTPEATRRLFAAASECAYCDKPMTGRDKTLDHMRPVSRGGLHSLSNAVICCYSCNSRKHALPFGVWLQRISPHIARRFLEQERAA